MSKDEAGHVFETDLAWTGGAEYEVRSDGAPPLSAATPPEFGGPPARWSPEALLVASAAGCILSTLLFFAKRFRLEVAACTASAKGTVEKTPDGLRFTGIDVSVALEVPDRAAADKAASLRLEEKLEKYCLVSRSLACPVRLALEVTAADDRKA